MALFSKSNKPAMTGYKPIRQAPAVTLLPISSEKAVRLQKLSQYLFAVRPGVSKIKVKKAIEAAYGVKVVAVNSINLPRKTVRRGRISGRTRERRHMVVRLLPGQTIELSKTV